MNGALFTCSICLRSRDVEEHLAILDEEFRRLYRNNIDDTPLKHMCVFCYESVLDLLVVEVRELAW